MSEPASTGPQHDPAVLAPPGPGELWVLIQVLPRVEVLASSPCRERLLAEAREMVALRKTEPVAFQWFVRKAPMHLA